MALVYEMASAVERSTAFGTETLTHEVFEYHHDPIVGRVTSRRRLGVMQEGAFVPHSSGVWDSVTIEGAEYDALLVLGLSADAVAAQHRATVALNG